MAGAETMLCYAPNVDFFHIILVTNNWHLTSYSIACCQMDVNPGNKTVECPLYMALEARSKDTISCLMNQVYRASRQEDRHMRCAENNKSMYPSCHVSKMPITALCVVQGLVWILVTTCFWHFYCFKAAFHTLFRLFIYLSANRVMLQKRRRSYGCEVLQLNIWWQQTRVLTLSSLKTLLAQ